MGARMLLLRDGVRCGRDGAAGKGAGVYILRLDAHHVSDTARCTPFNMNRAVDPPPSRFGDETACSTFGRQVAARQKHSLLFLPPAFALRSTVREHVAFALGACLRQ